MEEMLRNRYVRSIRVKLEVCRVIAATLMRELESSRLTPRERKAGFVCWFNVTRDADILEFVLELLRRHEREAREMPLSATLDGESIAA